MTGELTVTVVRYKPGRSVVANVGPARVRAMFSPDGRRVLWECSICGRGPKPGCIHSDALAATPSTGRKKQ